MKFINKTKTRQIYLLVSDDRKNASSARKQLYSDSSDGSSTPREDQSEISGSSENSSDCCGIN